MKDRVELSIVVLSYNNEPYILECLESIVRQNLESYEVFIVDDGSKDNSVKVINSFIADKPNFHLIEKINEGGAIASQVGLEKCTGQYCAIIDSDDIIANNAYKKLIGLIKEHDVEFASGRPVRLQDSYKVGLLNDNMENNVFAEDRILETEDERLELANTVFYWNSIYKRDFLNENGIKMPANLLIADRIFLYRAILKAKKIAVTSDEVYFWRKKGNEGALSLTDRSREFAMISDRLDSFEAQITLHQECHDDGIEMTKKMLELSLKRLFYPLYTDNEKTKLKYDKGWQNIYDLYRLFFLRHEAMFRHMSVNSNLDISNKIIIELILTKQYKRLFKFLAGESDVKSLLPILSKEMQREAQLEFEDSSFIRMIEEDGRVKACVNLKNLKLTSVKAVSRFFDYNELELELGDENDSFYIDCLDSGSYIIFGNAEDAKGKLQYVRFHNEKLKEFAQTKEFSYRGKEFVFLQNASVLNIYDEEKFVLIENEAEIYIKVNYPEKVSTIQFFNNIKNSFYEIEKIDDVTYKFNVNNLPQGKNVLFYRNSSGNYNYLTKYELVGGERSFEKHKKLFSKGFVEIKK